MLDAKGSRGHPQQNIGIAEIAGDLCQWVQRNQGCVCGGVYSRRYGSETRHLEFSEVGIA